MKLATGATVSRAAQQLAGKYLTFALGDEEYGLPVLKVREIIKMMDITAVPQVPALRQGRHQPARQGHPGDRPAAEVRLPGRRTTPSARASSSSKWRCGVERVMMGIVVDAVSEVLNIAADEIEATPEFGERVTPTTCAAWRRSRARVKFLLDLDRILGADGISGRRWQRTALMPAIDGSHRS